MRPALALAALMSFAVVPLACADDEPACYVGDYVICACASTGYGYAACLPDQRGFGACSCNGVTPGVDASR